ncbi:MAG: YraN family protein, partial [Actinomycetota bacterium]
MVNQQVQMVGEDSAAGFLEGRGMRVLCRNWRCRFGELDLVALDGTTLVFVEVKCRTRDYLYDPALAVDMRKQLRVRRLAEAYIAMERPNYQNCRFDVVSVVAANPVRLTHLA